MATTQATIDPNRLQDDPFDLDLSASFPGMTSHKAYGSEVKLGHDLRGQATVQLRHSSGTVADILLHGATPTSFITADGHQVVYVDPLSQRGSGEFNPKDPVRGGLFACIPSLGPDAPGGVHGFARVSDWKVVDHQIDTESVSITMRLTDSNVDQKQIVVTPWYGSFFEFNMKYTVAEDSFSASLVVENKNTKRPLTIKPVFHNYFACDPYLASIHGLEGLENYSKVAQSSASKQAEVVETAGKSCNGPVGMTYNDWGIQGQPHNLREIEHVFLGLGDSQDEISIKDPASGKKLSIEHQGLNDLIFWNPFVQKSRVIPDLSDGGYRDFLCAEPGIVEADGIEITAGSISEAIGQTIKVSSIQ